MNLDTLILGGGIAGLWALHELSHRGHSALLIEQTALGHGQTIASQGILHSGLKYSLTGLLHPSTTTIARAADLWRACLNGTARPDLSRSKLRAAECHLWQTNSLRSRLSTLAARKTLRVQPTELISGERPAALRNCPGTVYFLQEQVIDPASILTTLVALHTSRLLRLNSESQIEFDVASPGQVRNVTLFHRATGEATKLRPRWLILTAGAGNAPLRQRLGLTAVAMQRRPLHMTVVRGPLPLLNGHCIDGTRTRVTITTAEHSAGQTIWQIGGQLAEDGVNLDSPALIERARSELAAVLPGLNFAECEWTTYRIDRAEQRTRLARRPSDVGILREGNTITAWPTKLVLAPRLAQRVADLVDQDEFAPSDFHPAIFANWPKPTVAHPPWQDAFQASANELVADGKHPPAAT